jgi:CheY-like chemotaxis protein
MQDKPLLRLMVVDDNRDAADSLCMLLKYRGYECRAAYTGQEGLEAARTYQPDCLILDIAMPGMDGYTVARRVRQQPGMEQVGLVALTAYSDERHIRRAREAGFDSCLVKPADTDHLERTLKMLIEINKLATRTEELARLNVALAGQTKELLQEVKEDIQELKEDVKEIKEDLRAAKEGGSGPPAG